jgi:hypothetical protein
MTRAFFDVGSLPCFTQLCFVFRKNISVWNFCMDLWLQSGNIVNSWTLVTGMFFVLSNWLRFLDVVKRFLLFFGR